MFDNMSGENKAIITIVALVIVVAVAITFFSSMIVNVEAGHKAVITDGFGVGKTFDEGWNVKNPMSGVTKVRYNTQEWTEIISVRSEDGYNVNVDFTIRYHLQESAVSSIQLNNPDYVTTTIAPELRSVARKVVSDNNWTGEELNREKTYYESAVETMLTPQLLEYHIIAETVLIRNLDFPDTVDTAWQLRASSEVDVQTADFKLLEADLLAQQEIVIAESEANATIVLATGQAEAIRILADETNNLNNGTMDYILSLKYIQMLRDPETNVKFVLVTDGTSNPFIIDMSQFEEAP